MRRLLALVLALCAALAAMPATAQSDEQVQQRARDVLAVFRGEMAYADVFAPAFIAAVPEDRFDALREQLTAQMGPIQDVESVEYGDDPGTAAIALRFRDAVASGPMRLESAHPYRVAGLLLNSIRPANADGLSALDLVRQLPGTSSVLFARIDGSEVLASHNADRQMALGSTFKLYVLSALVRSVEHGEHRWDEVVRLDRRSYPSGQLQDWPQGTPLTLQALATLMVSISDNTATDQLIAVLGRETVERELALAGHSEPAGNLPFLTTRELFLLKLGSDDDLAAYAAASEAQRRVILAGLTGELLDPSHIQTVFSEGPRGIDVEWFASADDLARVLAVLARDPVANAILAVNPGMPAEHFAAWEYVGYKGGSEPGVLNLTWLLRDPDGAWWVLTLGWNNPDVNVSEVQLLGIAQQMLEEARNRP